MSAFFSWRRLAIGLGIALGCGVLFLSMRGVVGIMGTVRSREIDLEWQRLKAGIARVGYPADKGAHTTPEYLRLLVQAGALQESDLLFFRQWVIANASVDDAPQTVLLATKSYYAYIDLGKKDATGFFLFNKDGRGSSSRLAPVGVVLPPRTPAFLPPE